MKEKSYMELRSGEEEVLVWQCSSCEELLDTQGVRSRCIVVGKQPQFFLLQLSSLLAYSPVGGDCRILTVSLQTGKTPTPNKCPAYNIKPSDGEAPVILEFWGMQNTFS